MIKEIVRKGSKVSTTYKVKTNKREIDDVVKDIFVIFGTNKSIFISVEKE
jgi:hypothetical protein